MSKRRPSKRDNMPLLEGSMPSVSLDWELSGLSTCAWVVERGEGGDAITPARVREVLHAQIESMPDDNAPPVFFDWTSGHWVHDDWGGPSILCDTAELLHHEIEVMCFEQLRDIAKAWLDAGSRMHQQP